MEKGEGRGAGGNQDWRLERRRPVIWGLGINAVRSLP